MCAVSDAVILAEAGPGERDGGMTEQRITEEQAQRIWRRAAELQAAAAERAEIRRRSGVEAAWLEEGLTVDDVRGAAVEAGIGDEFVEAAIAELESERELMPAAGSWLARAANRLLDGPPQVLSVSRELPASAEVVFEAMHRIFADSPFGLHLRDTRGVDLFTDGVFVFDTSGGMQTGFEKKLSGGGVHRLFVMLRRVRGGRDRCDVSIRAPAGRLGRGVMVSGGLTATAGGTGAAAGAAAGPSIASVLGAGGLIYTGVIGAAAIVTGLSAGTLVLSGYRALHARALAGATDALESLVQALAVDVRTRDVLTQRASKELVSGD